MYTISENSILKIFPESFMIKKCFSLDSNSEIARSKTFSNWRYESGFTR